MVRPLLKPIKAKLSLFLRCIMYYSNVICIDTQVTESNNFTSTQSLTNKSIKEGLSKNCSRFEYIMYLNYTFGYLAELIYHFQTNLAKWYP